MPSCNRVPLLILSSLLIIIASFWFLSSTAPQLTTSQHLQPIFSPHATIPMMMKHQKQLVRSNSVAQSSSWHPVDCLHPPLTPNSPLRFFCYPGRAALRPRVRATWDHCDHVQSKPTRRSSSSNWTRLSVVDRDDTTDSQLCLIGGRGQHSVALSRAAILQQVSSNKKCALNFSDASKIEISSYPPFDVSLEKVDCFRRLSRQELLAAFLRDSSSSSDSPATTTTIVITGDSTGRELFFSLVGKLRGQPLVFSYGAHKSLVYHLFEDGSDSLRDLVGPSDLSAASSSPAAALLLRVVCDFAPYESDHTAWLFDALLLGSNNNGGGGKVIHVLMKSFWFLKRPGRNNHGPLQQLNIVQDTADVLREAEEYLGVLRRYQQQHPSSYKLFVPSTAPMRRILRSFLTHSDISSFNRLIAKRNELRRRTILPESHIPFAELLLARDKPQVHEALGRLKEWSTDAVHFGCKLMHFESADSYLDRVFASSSLRRLGQQAAAVAPQQNKKQQFNRNDMSTFAERMLSNGPPVGGCRDEINGMLWQIIGNLLSS